MVDIAAQKAELKKRQASLVAQQKALEAEARELRRQERIAQQEARRREENDHSDRMYTKIGEPLAGLNGEQHVIVYAAAWEQGHSSGYSEVEGYYADFAEMARKLIELSR